MNRKPGMVFKQVENVNYAIAIGKGEFKFSLVGVAGSDIAVDGSMKLSLALIWQLMRAHLVSFLATLKSKTPRSTDSAMVRWANETVEAAGYASRIKDFGDKSLADGLFLLDLLTAVERRASGLREAMWPGRRRTLTDPTAPIGVASTATFSPTAPPTSRGCSTQSAHTSPLPERRSMELTLTARCRAGTRSRAPASWAVRSSACPRTSSRCAPRW